MVNGSLHSFGFVKFVAVVARHMRRCRLLIAIVHLPINLTLVVDHSGPVVVLLVATTEACGIIHIRRCIFYAAPGKLLGNLRGSLCPKAPKYNASARLIAPELASHFYTTRFDGSESAGGR